MKNVSNHCGFCDEVSKECKKISEELESEELEMYHQVQVCFICGKEYKVEEGTCSCFEGFVE